MDEVDGPDEAPTAGEAEGGPGAPQGPRRWIVVASCAVLLLVGLGVRLHGLDDAPMLFHPTRQLHSAIIARSIYLDRTAPADDPQRRQADRAAAREERIEAPITENIVATLDQVAGHESIWIGGLWSTLVWLAGGVCLFLILGRFTTLLGRIAGLAVDLLLPLAVEGGRSVQPDPLMVTLALATTLLVLRHDERPTWARVLAAGAVGGAAVLVKPMALVIVVAAFAGQAIHRRGWLGALRDRQSWAYVALLVAPVGLSRVLGVVPGMRGEAGDYFIGHILRERQFYVNLGNLLSRNVGPIVIAVGLVGAFAGSASARRLLASLWAGYLVTVVAFDYRMATHTYYHLALLPILAMGWGLLVGAIPGWLDRHRYRVARVVLYPALAIALLTGVWLALFGTHQPVPGRDPIKANRALGHYLHHDAAVIGITHSDGRELAYYARLDSRGEIPGIADRVVLKLQGRPEPDISELVRGSGADYVVVTDVPKLLADPQLYDVLTRSYEVVEVGHGWAVLDVHRPPSGG
ncbi:MAG: glycosyltransferase family 39 protein [Acidimicrobiales bacterium]